MGAGLKLEGVDAVCGLWMKCYVMKTVLLVYRGADSGFLDYTQSMLTESMSPLFALTMRRCLLFPTQVAQGALRGPLIHPPQDNVLCSF